jgi:glycosyltransferase involved in cell wall biosynthesis
LSPLGAEEQRELDRQAERLARLARDCADLRILSTLPYTKSAFWSEAVETVAARPNRLRRLTERAGIVDLSVIFRLLRRARQQDLVLLTGGERVDLIYLAIAAWLPWIRTPHVVADAHWQKADGLAHRLQRILLRMGRRLTAQVQPHSDEEIDIYHRVFGIPSATLRAVPWSTTLTGHDVSPAREDEAGDFVLTGGLSFRDYPTLFEALRDLDLKVEVGLPNQPDSERIVELGRSCPNVTCHTDWSNARFIRMMAGCRIFVLSIEAGLTRSTADQTILNAMYFGKIVVATDSIGSRIYLKDGVNGFLVPERSVAGWSDTLKRVARLSPEEYARIGNRAAIDARVHFNESLRMIRTLEAALETVGPRASGSAPA